MATIEVRPDVLVVLCQKAKKEGKSITDIIDDLLSAKPCKGNGEQTVSRTCKNCKNPIDYEITPSKGYCDYCESVVFID